MKFTNFQIVKMFDDLGKYAQTKMPQKISYAITKNLMILQKEYQCYERELQKLFENYKDKTEKDSDGEIKKYENGLPMIKDEYMVEFEKDLNELLSIKVDVELYLIPEETFDYIDENNRYDPLSPNDIVFLQTVICTT